MNKISTNVAPPAGPCCLVIFGASGDLTHRLLVPALYNLAAGGLLPDAFAIIGIARRAMSNHAFRSDLAQSLRRLPIRGIDERITGGLLARAISPMPADRHCRKHFELTARQSGAAGTIGLEQIIGKRSLIEQPSKELRRHDDKPGANCLDGCDNLITAGRAIDGCTRAHT